VVLVAEASDSCPTVSQPSMSPRWLSPGMRRSGGGRYLTPPPLPMSPQFDDPAYTGWVLFRFLSTAPRVDRL